MKKTKFSIRRYSIIIQQNSKTEQIMKFPLISMIFKNIYLQTIDMHENLSFVK
jgi:hypothetical protein